MGCARGGARAMIRKRFITEASTGIAFDGGIVGGEATTGQGIDETAAAAADAPVPDVKLTPPTPPPPAVCSYDMDMDRAGGDFQLINNVATLGVCCDHCSATDGCKAWAWDSNSKGCLLKSSVAALSRKTGTVSGMRAGLCDSVADSDRAGGDFKTVDNVASKGACCDHCSAEAACRAWAWDSNTKGCWLKSSVPALTSKKGTVSGLRAGTTDTFQQGTWTTATTRVNFPVKHDI